MVDVRLNVILDPEHSGGRALPELARAAVSGGATLLQYRDKTAETGAFVANARAILAAIEGTGVPLLINDRIDVALAAGTDGVHIGQSDMTPEDARRLLGPAPIVGLTVRSMAEAEAVPVDLVDYVGIGGVFATSSKQNKNPPIGLDGLAEISAFLDARGPDLGRVAIAGITADTTAKVITAGAHGVAVISAVSRAADPTAAAAALRHVVDQTLTTGKTVSS